MGLTGAAARMVAGACERSALLTAALRLSRFTGRDRVIAEIRRIPGPREVEAVRDGVRFRLDLADDVQRAIYFGGYDAAERGALRAIVGVGAICLDVGANVGFYALHLARQAGPRGVVYAFEPDPSNAARLRANCALNDFGSRIRPMEAAVSDREGAAVLHRSDPAHSGWGSLARFEDIAAGTAEVPCVTIDGFLEREAIGCVDLLKVDVEAGEFELLRGAARSLGERRVRYVCIEWNGPRLAARGRTFEEFLGVFQRAGYEPRRLHLPLLERMRRGTVPPERIWTNLLFEAGTGPGGAPSRGA